jgi:hypothetical protein
MQRDVGSFCYRAAKRYRFPIDCVCPANVLARTQSLLRGNNALDLAYFGATDDRQKARRLLKTVYHQVQRMVGMNMRVIGN